ncbi:L-seryl-tRNA(Sec) selenium transferase [Acetobacterium woodii]|uniref:L-seryl-tRNA(Sec) selenium transferase n=1 Tax=Acetobacterium woodii (strain ATCC 29683 / DSM 1030 / JCM 2381 / KCTC 1655 / WB1) TaxID=931626 RepID=H6LB56_ACEWD|nr:L-seryl-tRNA(Sec) selenium transferase [Acetobacterium woodii]AFA47608.1 L-seryl-tRNA selenium transferase SelA [Acetobacterium woodii DSM 1030]
MVGKINSLRAIPKIDDLLKDDKMIAATTAHGNAVVVDCARACVNKLRDQLLSRTQIEPFDEEQLLAEIETQIRQETQLHLRPVINGTGIILHTNLGRAVLSEAAAQAAYEVATNYSTLEYDWITGERGSRYSHVDFLLEKLCGCEAAMVVNNNAAAVLLVLSTMAKNKEVVISRGELVEIGGSFRVPEVMAQSGAILVEVGSTNKTKKADYVKAIVSDKTGALLKVHTSNYKIMGFTEAVSLAELAEIGKNNNIPVIYDLGSGGFFKLAESLLGDEPNVFESMKSGADIICFSGDKLLGGPQAGIIIGNKKYIEAMKKNPLTRALRVDKMTLAALEATLRLYLDTEKAQKEIPLLSQLSITKEMLFEKAQKFVALLKQFSSLTTEIVEENGQVGGGAMPNQMIPSVCVILKVNGLSANALDQKFNQAEIPIIGRIRKDQYLLDMRTIKSREFEMISKTIEKLLV